MLLFLSLIQKYYHCKTKKTVQSSRILVISTPTTRVVMEFWRALTKHQMMGLRDCAIVHTDYLADESAVASGGGRRRVY